MILSHSELYKSKFAYSLIVLMIFFFSSCENESFDKNDAVKTAEEINFNKGINNWKIKQVWNAEYNKNTWVIISTFIESQTKFGYSAAGKKLIIDSGSGKILENKDWYLR